MNCKSGILNRRQKGFSLIETVIYVSLLAIILVVLINTIFTMNRLYRYLNLSRHIQTSAITALDRMVRDIRDAESVNVGASTLGTSPGVLTLNTTTSSNNPQTFQFFVSNGVLIVKQDEVDIGPLTLSDVVVDNLIFRHIVTGVSKAVKIEMTLKAGTSTANFYATAVLRDSY